ncbi:MAG: hypothetical protein WC779_06540 [Candidatus Omnitrophota bacterium]|jgi:hypothetical protein
MARSKLTQKEFNEIFEFIKEDVLSNKPDKKREGKTLRFISDNLKSNGTRLIYLLCKKLAKIDKKIDINVEIAEMYLFAAIYCIAKRLRMDVKEINALLDDIDKETKNILEGSMKAREERRYLAKMFNLKYMNGNR